MKWRKRGKNCWAKSDEFVSIVLTKYTKEEMDDLSVKEYLLDIEIYDAYQEFEFNADCLSSALEKSDQYIKKISKDIIKDITKNIKEIYE